MLFEIVLVLLGLLFLTKGADFLVDGSSRIAKKFGISPLVIGLTVVAFGTSLPELFVNVIAALDQNSQIAVGNVVGSNIANIALILGVAATIQRLSLKKSTVTREIPFMLFVSMIFLALCFKNGFLAIGENVIGLAGGLLLLIFFLIYLFFIVRQAQLDHTTERQFAKELPKDGKSSPILILSILVGFVLLVAGAELLVKGGVAIAEIFGVPEFIIAATMIAVGTSLPELATVVVAALKREADIVVGNVVGSNIFNLSLVLGSAALIHPMTVNIDMWISFAFMFLLSLLLLPLTMDQKTIDRRQGLFLLGSYLVYLVIIFAF